MNLYVGSSSHAGPIGVLIEFHGKGNKRGAAAGKQRQDWLNLQAVTVKK